MEKKIFLRIRDWLRDAIERGDYRPGQRIPSEDELMKRFGVSRGTVRQAIYELVLEGWLYRVQGSGTYVSRPKYRQTLSRLTSFTEDMRSLGLTPSARLLACRHQPADRKIAEALKIAPGEEVIYIERLRLANNEPMALNISIMPYKFVPNLEKENLETKSLYEILERQYGLLLFRAEQTLEPTIADQKTAKLLSVPVGAPILLVEGIVYLKNGTPIEWVRILYRGDRYKFHIIAVR